jgi:hypothetical protein
MANYTSFLKDFFDHMVDVVRDNGKENLEPVDFYPTLKSMREMLFQKYKIDLSSVDESALIEQLPSYVKLTLDELNLTHQDFVDVVFLKKTTLDEKPLVEYIKKIHDDDSWSAGMYYFQGFLQEKDCQIKDFKEQIIKCFESMKEGQDFELLSNVAVFIEAYSQTHEGKEFLEKEFTMDKPQDSFRELFRRMNNASVFNAVGVRNDKNGNLKCQYTSGGGGEFDGLYIFPDDKGGLMVKQVQISATSDMGTGIEKNSVFRHAISNVIIAKALDNAFINHNETTLEHEGGQEWFENTSLTDAFKISPNEYHDEKIDILQEQKQKALLTIMKEQYSGSFGDAKTFKDLIKDLNANLYDYIFECFGEKPPLKAYAVEDTIKELRYVDVSNVFVARTAYQKHPEYEKSTLGKMLGNDVDLNMKEFRHGLQLVGLSTFNNDNRGNTLFFQNEGLKIAFSGIVSRCVDNQGEVDATKLNKLGQEEFEKILFKNFILPDEKVLQRNFDVLNKGEVKDSFKFYISRIILREKDRISFYDKKIKDLNLDDSQTLKDICEKLLKVNFLDWGGDLYNQVKEKKEKIEIENEKIESDIKNLNNVLRYPDDKEMYNDNISGNTKLEGLYNFLKKSGYDGRNDKVKIDDYKKALIEMDKKNKTIDELEYPTIDDFGSSNEGEIVSKSSYKLPKSKK